MAKNPWVFASVTPYNGVSTDYVFMHSFANRANNGVVGVMHRFEPIAFVAFLSTRFAFLAFSLFSAFVRTVGLRPFQTI